MKFKTGRAHFFVSIISLILINACSETQNYMPFKVEEAYATKPLIGINSVAAYMVLKNQTNQTLTIDKISCDNFLADFHESKIDNHSKMVMKKLDKVVIKPNSEVNFQPSGKHIMIMSENFPNNLEVINCHLSVGKEKKYPLVFIIK
jgi:copper(I)-binding protein